MAFGYTEVSMNGQERHQAYWIHKQQISYLYINIIDLTGTAPQQAINNGLQLPAHIGLGRQ